ncbi:MAG: hypothetical protein ABI430_01520 [Candidatus Taylorbacteria bacterium]
MKLLVAVASVCLAIPAFAQAPPSGFELLVGYRNVRVPGVKFEHDTHSDDGFLPDADVPGSAGTTGFDNGLMHYAVVGVGYHFPFNDSLDLTADFGGLFGGTRDDRQNVNDFRAPQNGSFVYSEARYGLLTSLNLSYHIKNLSLGVEGTLTGIFIDNGWDRFGKDESQHTNFRLEPTIGPTIGYLFYDYVRAEVTVQAGDGGIVGAFSLRFIF